MILSGVSVFESPSQFLICFSAVQLYISNNRPRRNNSGVHDHHKLSRFFVMFFSLTNRNTLWFIVVEGKRIYLTKILLEEEKNIFIYIRSFEINSPAFTISNEYFKNFYSFYFGTSFITAVLTMSFFIRVFSFGNRK